MIRVVIYLVILLALAYGGMLLLQNPGHFTVDWYGHVVNTTAALGIAAIAIAAIIVWVVVRLVFGMPSALAYAARRRRREQGYAALSRGLIAVGSGDARAAARASAQASRQLRNDSLSLMLRAQAAHLAGDGHGAQIAFEELAEREETRVLGLRGLYAEANRRGDEEAARHFAAAAHRASPLPWSAQAVLGHRAAEQDWETALRTVESSVAAKLVDKETGERQRAVLETALAQDKEMSAPDQALSLARSAMKRAPDLAPPIVVAATLLTRRGEIRKASRLIEKAWPRCQHPDIARTYLDVRPGDSTSDRLSRAKTLMGLSAFDPVARMTVARAAIAAREFETARSAMEPLVGQGKRPTFKMCMVMAELEEGEHGSAGHAREWQARASHAALDPAWVADGIVYDEWAPISPTTGRLDAFSWQVPVERMGRVMDAMPAHAPPERALPKDPASSLVPHDEPTMLAAPAAPAIAAPSSVQPTSLPEPAAPLASQVGSSTSSEPSAVASKPAAVSKPAEIGPIAAEAVDTKPALSDTAAIVPTEAAPAADVKPAAAEHTLAEPAGAEPAGAEPAAARPVFAEPVVTHPAVADAIVAKPAPMATPVPMSEPSLRSPSSGAEPVASGGRPSDLDGPRGEAEASAGNGTNLDPVPMPGDKSWYRPTLDPKLYRRNGVPRSG